MWLQNKSKNAWLGFETGISKVDILPESTFEVSDAVGSVILRILGSDNWIVKSEAPKKKETVKPEVVGEEEEKPKPKSRIFKKK